MNQILFVSTESQPKAPQNDLHNQEKTKESLLSKQGTRKKFPPKNEEKERGSDNSDQSGRQTMSKYSQSYIVIDVDM